MKSLIFFTISFLILFIPAQSQENFLDKSFADEGVFSLDLEGNIDIATSLHLTDDSKIIIGGTSIIDGTKDYFLMKLNMDGSIDSSFADSGVLHFDFEGDDDTVTGMEVYDDGRILLFGNSVYENRMQFSVLRCLENGMLDNSFGNNGLKILSVQNDAKIEFFTDAKILDNNKIVLTGQIREQSDNQDFCTLRLTEDGKLDTTFGINGILRIDVGHGDYPQSIEIAEDGSIFQTGTTWYNESGNYGDFTIMKYTHDGKFDDQFGVVQYDFELNLDFGSHIKIHDNALIIGGMTTDSITGRDFTLIKLKMNGELDNSFGQNGWFRVDCNNNFDLLSDIKILDSGSIILGGYEYDSENVSTTPYFIKSTSSGELDKTFGVEGKIYFRNENSYNYSNSFSIQNNGKIISVGSSVFEIEDKNDLLVFRLTPDIISSLDVISNANINIRIFPNPAVNQIRLISDEKLSSDYSVELYTITGHKISASKFSNSMEPENVILVEIKSELPPGYYIVQLLSKNKKYTVPFIKK